ncbi:MAG TPA: YdeI/OmpD-associated family protein [Terracidiphilus sp.]
MKTYKFTARIESASSGGACVFFPFDVEKEFGVKGRVPVKVVFDGIPYTGSMIKYGNPQHMLPILKEIREQIGKGPGDMVDVEVQKDEAERTVVVPPALATLLEKEKLTGVFAKLSFTHRREYCRWINDAKREETRQNRVAKSVEMLRAGVKTPDGATRKK